MSLLSCISFATQAEIETSITLPTFNQQGISQWEQKIFSGKTHYQVVQQDGQDILQAISQGSASGLFLEQRIDLAKTPFINWRWKIQNRLTGLQENTKQGDDYAARIYLVVKKGLFGLNSLAMNYVWSSNYKKGSLWNNAYAGDSVKMLALRDTKAKLDTWYDEKRNVYQDLINLFGDKGSQEANLKAYQYIDIIALMTDTDDSDNQAESFYGNISFSAD